MNEKKHKPTLNDSFRGGGGIQRHVGLCKQGQCVYMGVGEFACAFVFACVADNWRSIHTWVTCKT